MASRRAQAGPISPLRKDAYVIVSYLNIWHRPIVRVAGILLLSSHLLVWVGVVVSSPDREDKDGKM